MGRILSQSIHVSDHQDVYFKYLKILLVNYTSIIKLLKMLLSFPTKYLCEVWFFFLPKLCIATDWMQKKIWESLKLGSRDVQKCKTMPLLSLNITVLENIFFINMLTWNGFIVIFKSINIYFHS